MVQGWYKATTPAVSNSASAKLVGLGISVGRGDHDGGVGEARGGRRRLGDDGCGGRAMTHGGGGEDTHGGRGAALRR